MRFRTKPFSHQLREFEEHARDPVRAIFWEQGTGKSKLIVDTAALLYLEEEIDGLLVVAPNGVHRNWTDTEVLAHLSPDVEEVALVRYDASRAGTKGLQADLSDLLGFPGLAVLAMSYEGFVTERGKTWSKRFLTQRRALYVLDESARIKSPSAKRTKTILASARYANYRRILTGTPIANGPFDVYSPLQFLDPDFWRGRGWGRFAAFQGYFGVFKTGYNGRTQREYRELVEYRHLDRLREILAPVSSRVTKDEVLDLPEKLYSTHRFALPREQREVYDRMRDEFLVEIEGEDEVATAPLAIKRLLRLQQIVCGYLPLDDGETSVTIDPNARLALLREIALDTSHPTIVWARFRRDVDQIVEMIEEERSLGGVVRYDGAVDTDGRARAVAEFQSGRAQFFVANPAAGGEGLTLHAAQTVVYYSNSFKLTERLQSEDRAHRIGQRHPVHYIDLVAEDTIDERIVEVLRAKRTIASAITGDRLREWLT